MSKYPITEGSNAWRQNVYSQKITKQGYQEAKNLVSLYNQCVKEYNDLKKLKKEVVALKSKCITATIRITKKELEQCLKLDSTTKREILVLANDLTTYYEKSNELEQSSSSLISKMCDTLGPTGIFFRYTEVGPALVPDRARMNDMAIGFKLNFQNDYVNIYSIGEYEEMTDKKIPDLHKKVIELKNKKVMHSENIMKIAKIIKQDEDEKQKLLDATKVKKPQVVVIEHRAVDEIDDDDDYDGRFDKYYDQ